MVAATNMVFSLISVLTLPLTYHVVVDIGKYITFDDVHTLIM